MKPGNAMPLRSHADRHDHPQHRAEARCKGGQIARSAGAYAQLVGRDAGYAQIRLGSGELRMVPDSCMATVGAVSNPDHMNEVLGKAGRVRHKGRRPHVRGVAMNPVDHPHGGGEGKTSGGRHPVTPWGKPTKGRKTRTNKADGQVHHPSSSREEGALSDDPLGLERSVRRRLSAEEGRNRAELGPQGRDQDLVAPLDHHAAVRRPDLRRPQRPEARAGAGQRRHGRQEARRVRADPVLPRPRAPTRRPRGSSDGQASQSAPPEAGRSDGQGPHAAHQRRAS